MTNSANANLAVFFGVLVLSVLTTAMVLLESNRQEIIDNWVDYRCSPVVMPFASLFGKDPVANFEYCIGTRFNNYAGIVLEPVYYVMKLIADTLADITASINDIRGMLSGVRGSFLTIIAMVFGKLQNTLAEVMVLFVRMQDIINRMVATMYVLAYTGVTGADTGVSLMNGPIGEVIDWFCFAPHTRVPLADATSVTIDAIRLGDVLLGGQTVTSILETTSDGQTLFDVSGVTVSGSHLIFDAERWGRVSDLPTARPASATQPRLWCLNTSNNEIPVLAATGAVLRFRDFEECSDADIVAAQQMHPTGTWDTGFGAGTRVRTTARGAVPVEAVAIGDVLAGGDVVLGTVRHAGPSEFIVIDGVRVLPDTLGVGHPGRARQLNPLAWPVRRQRERGPCVAFGLLTSRQRVPVRGDTRDWEFYDDSETTAARDEIILARLNKE